MKNKQYPDFRKFVKLLEAASSQHSFSCAVDTLFLI